MRALSLCTPLTAAVLALSVAGTTTFVTPPAAAQAAKPDKKTRDAARKAYGEGEAAYGKGEYRAAVIAFKKANELIPSPHAHYWIAMSLDKNGNLDEAIANFEELLADPNVGKIGEEKVSTARERLDALKKTPGKLELVTEPAGASVTVDGQPQMGETPLTLELAPGTRKISVTAPGMNTEEFEIDVEPGSSSDKSIELTAAPEEPIPVVAPPPPAEAPVDDAPPPKKRSKVPAYVTLGIAGASAIVGTIFGVQALGKKSDFDDEPTSGSADDVERNALIADMAFGVAITLGVTGVVLLTSADSDPTKEATAKNRKLPKRARLVVAPYASPNGGGAAAHWTF